MSRGFKDRTGERRLMNCGLWAEIIAYRGCHDIDIKFENGDILYNKDYYNFTKGSILCDSYNVRLGEKRLMNCGKIAEIVEYRRYDDIDIRFEDGILVKNKEYYKFLKGSIKYPTDKTHRKAKHCWGEMMDRCYNKDCKNYKYYGEKGVIVCEEWHNYSNFKKWYDENIYEIEGEIIHLDKDILSNENKIYSPETCIFVPSKINQIFRIRINTNGLPTGVRYNEQSKKYIVYMSINGKTTYIGTYETSEEACISYIQKRVETDRKTIEAYENKIPKEIYLKLIDTINKKII